ncbi:MAG: metalloprotease TldD [Candidatus Tectomicrobia bacterium]|uniref:Metalloprotease TldD n=1 Tax=Tectimicrobiota bacterium TaxID=2528274 RepID=A0A938B3D1_UNCTE|nr:metalloprotease TldD [Candidatus Tectomicrobia bacterium]
MTQALSRPAAFFDDKYGMDSRSLQRVLGQTLAKQVDYADLYFQYEVSDAVSLEEGLVKQASKHVNQGVGVRAIAGEKTGYAFSDEITIPTLELAARAARQIAGSGPETASVAIQGAQAPASNLYPVQVPGPEIPMARKLDLLQRIDTFCRAYDSRITKVQTSFTSSYKLVLVATSDGLVVGDVQPLMRLNVLCIAEEGSNRQSGSSGGGGRMEYDFFLDNDQYLEYAREAARRAILNLDAIDAPAGSMDVVLGSGWPGILLHEAIGHGLEGDFNRKGVSAFSGRIGQKVASELCTVVDDGTLPGRRGSLNVDDEGTPTGRTVLVENGILRGYLQDRLNARLMGVAPTGNGRRESYAHMPMPRMTNTFMLNGASDPEEIIASVDSGLYAVSFGGGQVDITNGKFVFSASEAYLIENGKLTHPVKGASLVGNGPDVLTRITMVGNDMALDTGVGTCGKNGQSVPVGVGLPTIRVNGLTVGGTRA